MHAFNIGFYTVNTTNERVLPTALLINLALPLHVIWYITGRATYINVYVCS